MGITAFTARIESSGGLASSVVLRGDLDMHAVPILEESLGQLDRGGVAALVIDLREVTFLGTDGLRAFLIARARAEARGRQLLLVGAGPRVRRVFELTGSESLLTDRDVVIMPGS